MKKYTLLLSMLLFLGFSMSVSAVPVAVDAPVADAAADDALGAITLADLTDMSRKDVEAQIGRKLSLSERIALGVMKRKAKRAAKKAGADMEDAGQTDGFAIAALVLGILSLFSGLILGILAIIFGSIAKRRIREDPSLEGQGMAQAGFVMGIIACALTVLVLVLALSLGLFLI